MRSIFIGTVEISWHCLLALLEIGEQVTAIFTMPDERAPHISAYKAFDDLGVKYGVPVYKQVDVNSPECIEAMSALRPEVIYVIGWPRLVKPPLLSLPTKGCIGIHSSLLPKYRGGAPVNWGLINGETEWGVSLIYLDEGADTGDIIAQESFPILLQDTCKSVYDKATEASIRLLGTYVPLLVQGKAPRVPQDDRQSTSYPQRTPEQGVIDWNKTAMELYNWVRALTHPYPGAFTFLPEGRKVFVWEAELAEPAVPRPEDALCPPGSVLALLPYQGLLVQTGEGTIVLRRLQVEGDAEMPATVWGAHHGKLAEVRFLQGPQE